MTSRSFLRSTVFASLAALAVRAAPSDTAATQGWQPLTLGTTLGFSRSADSGNAVTGLGTLGLSASWKRGLFSLTPSGNLDYQKDFQERTRLVSGTGQLAAGFAPLSFLSFGASGYYTAQDAADDWGGYLNADLAWKLGAGFALGLSGSGSTSRLGAPFPGLGLSLSQDLDVASWSLSGGWSYQKSTYEALRVSSTKLKGQTTLSDTALSEDSRYGSRFSASAEASLDHESWSLGPTLSWTYATVPLASGELAVTRKNATSSKVSTSTARNQTLELGGNGAWTPLDWLSFSLSVSYTWSWQDVNLSGGRKGTSSFAQVRQQARRLDDLTAPPPAGLDASLSAEIEF
jgi:hypothetical protein